MERTYRTTDEWEQFVGEQIRTARVSQRVDQARLASLADVSVGTLSNLERGKGSTLKTLVAVVRALGRTDWLESLAPQIALSPLVVLRSNAKRPPVRVRATRSEAQRATKPDGLHDS